MRVVTKNQPKKQYRFETLDVGQVFTWGSGTDWYVKTDQIYASRIGLSSDGHTAPVKVTGEYILRGVNLTIASTVEITAEV